MTENNYWLELVEDKNFREYIYHKYGKNGEKTTPKILNDEMKKFENKYENKIILGKPEDFTTDQEKKDKMEYEAIKKVFHKLVPETKKIDDEMLPYIKINEACRKFLKFIKGSSIYILGILIFLALIKYLFN